MKKLAIIIMMLAAVALVYAMRNKSEGDDTNPPATSRDQVYHPDPSNATFIFDGEPVTLSAGRNEKPVAPDSALVEETVILDKFAYDDINSDNKEDTIILIARYGGGSGTFIYLTAFVSGPVTYRGGEAVFIGDRIIPRSVSINKNIVTVEYLDRKEDESFTDEPTVLTSKQFIYRAGAFEER